MNDTTILLDFIVRCQAVLCSFSGGSSGADVDMYFHSLKNGNLVHYSNTHGFGFVAKVIYKKAGWPIGRYGMSNRILTSLGKAIKIMDKTAQISIVKKKWISKTLIISKGVTQIELPLILKPKRKNNSYPKNYGDGFKHFQITDTKKSSIKKVLSWSMKKEPFGQGEKMFHINNDYRNNRLSIQVKDWQGNNVNAFLCKLDSTVPIHMGEYFSYEFLNVLTSNKGRNDMSIYHAIKNGYWIIRLRSKKNNIEAEYFIRSRYNFLPTKF